MSRADRNAPCPCGSGKKYKRCCGAVGAASRPEFTRSEGASAIDKLHSFANREEFAADRRLAEGLFWGPRADELDREVWRQLAGQEMVLINFVNFFTIDLDLEDGKAIVNLFLERRGPSLAPGERRFLERLAESYVGIYEVVDVRPGEGLRLRNLWFEEPEIEVVERTASKTISRWDVLGTRLTRHPPGDMVIEGDLYPFPADLKARVVGLFEEQSSAQLTSKLAHSPQALLKRTAFLMHALWLETGPLAPQPRLATFDGFPLVQVTQYFTVTDEVCLIESLKACEDLQYEGDGRWVLLREVDGVHQLLSEMHLDAQDFVAVTMSRAHSEEARALLEGLAGQALCYRETGFETPTRRARNAPPDERAYEPGEADPSVSDIVKKALDSHYRRWLDDSIPALDGATPREAAADSALRPRLVQLLRELENNESRHPASGAEPYDTRWLRGELGLDPS